MTHTLYNRGRTFEFTNKAYRLKFVRHAPEPNLYPEWNKGVKYARWKKMVIGLDDQGLLRARKVQSKLFSCIRGKKYRGK